MAIKIKKIFLLLFLFVVFISGIYFIMKNPIEHLTNKDSEPTDTTMEDTTCPNLLVQTENGLLLYNTKIAQMEGQNPKLFANMDGYIKYLDEQRKNGIRCPVLYLQKENDTQGNDIYRIRPSPFNPEPGVSDIPMLYSSKNPAPYIDASTESSKYNKNMYYGFDPFNQYEGVYTVIDKIHDSTRVDGPVSENPMDPNWGGVVLTQNAVDSGKYDSNIVTRTSYMTPKTAFLPMYGNVNAPMPPPPAPEA
jgi:hypothetical protein